MAKLKPEFKDKDWLYQKFVVENLRAIEIANICGVANITIERILRRLNIRKPSDKVVERRKMAFRERYGADHHLQNPEILNKQHITNRSRYGTKCTLGCPAIREKIKQVHMAKRGVEYPMQDPTVLEKSRQTSQRKNGVDHPTKTAEFQAKSKATRIRKGTQKTIRNLSVSEMSSIYNIAISSINIFIRESKPSEEELFYFLENHATDGMTDIEHVLYRIPELTRFNKKPSELSMLYKPDFKLNETTYINSDGLYYHCEKRENDSRYHLNIRVDFENAGLRILQFRADEINFRFDIVKSMILNLVNKNIKIYARKTSIEVVKQKEASTFLEANHMMGDYKAKHIGLYYEDKLVSLLSYKIYKDKLKVERFCSLINHNVVGGFSRLLKQVEKLNIGNLPIHYWVDLRYGTGKFLLTQGFTFSHDALGWKWTDCHKTFNRLKCKANMDDRKLSEREYANEKGWAKIYDAGQRLYIKNVVL